MLEAKDPSCWRVSFLDRRGGIGIPVKSCVKKRQNVRELDKQQLGPKKCQINYQFKGEDPIWGVGSGGRWREDVNMS